MHTIARRMEQVTIASCLALITFLSDGLAAGMQGYRFTNNTSRHANDLHIEFDQPIQPNPAQIPPNTFPNSNVVNLTADFAQGLTGTGVEAGNNVVLTFAFNGGTPPKVARAYWTKSNTLTPNAQDPADTLRSSGAGQTPTYLLKADRTIQTQFTTGPATGNGRIVVVMDGSRFTFNTSAGDPGTTTAAKFASFIQSTPFGNVVSISGNIVIITTEVLDAQQPLQETVTNQDSSQAAFVSILSAPALGRPLAMALAILLLGTGVVVVYRRRSSTMNG